MYDVITIGAATTDVFVRSPQLDIRPGASDAAIEACFPLGAKLEIADLDVQTGGGGTNAAATFASLGFRTGTIATVGADDNGKLLVEHLKRYGIRTDLLQTDAERRTGYSIIILSGSGERTILVHRGASRHIDGRKIPWKTLKTRWFYMSSLGGDIALAERVIAHAKKTGAKVAWNPGSRELRRGMRTLGPLIGSCDVVLMNKEEASLLAGIMPADVRKAVAAFPRLPAQALVITDGRRGSFAVTPDGRTWAGLPDRRKPKNTTGAGDAFGSGTVASLMHGDDIGTALRVGTWNATGVVMTTGAKNGILTRFPGAAKLKKVPQRPWK